VEYEEYALVIELDGLAYHRGRREASDAARDNALMVAGRLVLRYRWVDVVGSPCAVAKQVAAALTMRGWSGTLRTCRHCS
jgi:very-short-patch-repair endonuclease